MMVQALSIIVTFIAAIIFGFLSRYSPKRDWDFIKGWPAVALLVISSAVWQVEFYNKMPPMVGELRLDCETEINELGVEYKDCKYVSEFNENYAQEQASYSVRSFIDWLIGGLVSIFWDIPLEIVGVWFGIFIARKAGGQQHVGN
jgi:hypothetical protein